MRLRWLKFESGNVVEYVTLPGLLFDRKIPQTNKWFKTPKLQFSTDNGETWQDVEDGPIIPFEQWKSEND
jgi:hypothetical protein